MKKPLLFIVRGPLDSQSQTKLQAGILQLEAPCMKIYELEGGVPQTSLPPLTV